jgi:hypothetical protein
MYIFGISYLFVTSSRRGEVSFGWKLRPCLERINCSSEISARIAPPSAGAGLLSIMRTHASCFSGGLRHRDTILTTMSKLSGVGQSKPEKSPLPCKLDSAVPDTSQAVLVSRGLVVRSSAHLKRGCKNDSDRGGGTGKRKVDPDSGNVIGRNLLTCVVSGDATKLGLTTGGPDDLLRVSLGDRERLSV